MLPLRAANWYFVELMFEDDKVTGYIPTGDEGVTVVERTGRPDTELASVSPLSNPFIDQMRGGVGSPWWITRALAVNVSVGSWLRTIGSPRMQKKTSNVTLRANIDLVIVTSIARL